MPFHRKHALVLLTRREKTKQATSIHSKSIHSFENVTNTFSKKR